MRARILSAFHSPSLWISFAILSLSAFFGRTPQIIDAMTGEIAQGFAVKISLWRTLSEPLVGPLLFMLRAHEPLQLITVTWLWLIVAWLVISLARARMSADRSGRRAVFSWLVRLPVFLSFFIALVLIIIFAPLPSNVIVNERPDTILLNEHSHSVYSHDGLISQRGLMNWHRRNGFDAFFITEHNHHEKSLEFQRQQDLGLVPADPVILVGQEYSGSNHILLLGLSRSFNSKDMPDAAAIDSAHAQNGVAIVAHWFTPGRNTRPLADYLQAGADGCEITNQAEGLVYDANLIGQIRAACDSLQLLQLGACDYHGYGSACMTWNALKMPHWRSLSLVQKRQAIMSILRERRTQDIQVLLYKDRNASYTGGTWLRPALNAIDYLRSLHPGQRLSWMLWLLLGAQILHMPKPLRRRLFSAPLWGLLGAIFSLSVGIVLLSQVSHLAGYNKIFFADGLWISVLGSILFIYNLVLYIKLKKL